MTTMTTMTSGAEADEQASPPARTVPAVSRIAVIRPPVGGPTPRSPLALTRDAASGDLLLSSFETEQVLVLNPAGSVIKAIGKESGLSSPYGVALDAKGRILIGEVQSGKIKIFSPGGIFVDEIDLSALRGEPVNPGRIVVDGSGRTFVVDLNHHEILILGPEGTLLRRLGPLTYLQKAAPLPDGRVIGLSAQGTAVSIFDAEGALVESFGKHGDRSARNVSFPTGFAVDARDRLWIADAFQHRLKVFSLDGELLFNFGRMEQKEGGFFFPVDLCFGDDGRLFVLEKGANRIQIFRVDDLSPPEDE